MSHHARRWWAWRLLVLLSLIAVFSRRPVTSWPERPPTARPPLPCAGATRCVVSPAPRHSSTAALSYTAGLPNPCRMLSNSGVASAFGGKVAYRDAQPQVPRLHLGRVPVRQSVWAAERGNGRHLDDTGPIREGLLMGDRSRCDTASRARSSRKPRSTASVKRHSPHRTTRMSWTSGTTGSCSRSRQRTSPHRWRARIALRTLRSRG